MDKVYTGGDWYNSIFVEIISSCLYSVLLRVLYVDMTIDFLYAKIQANYVNINSDTSTKSLIPTVIK